MVETSGDAALTDLQLDLLKPGGRLALLTGWRGAADLPGGRSVLSVIQGDAVAQCFIPYLIGLYQGGQFPFDRLVRFYPFSEINQAIADARRGDTVKPVLRISDPDLQRRPLVHRAHLSAAGRRHSSPRVVGFGIALAPVCREGGAQRKRSGLKIMVLKVAVAGTGYFSQFHFDGWSRLPEVKLVAVCSLDPAGLVDAAARHLIPRQFADVGAMLDATAPDLLDIVTPPAAHLAILQEAAKRKIAVICQKPLGGDLETAQAMVRVAEDAGITLVVHENFRFQPWYREARRLLEAGALGDIYNLTFRLRPGDGQGPRAYLDRQPYFQEMPRFLIHETAIHMIDTFRFLLGEMNGVFARLRRLNPHIKGEDAGLVLFDFASGAAAVFDGNRLVDFVADNPRLTMGEMLLEGSRATLRLDGFGRLWLKPHKGAEREHPYAWQDRGFGGDCVHALQRHVVAHLRDGAPLENAGAAYLRDLEIEEAIYRSAASGQREAL